MAANTDETLNYTLERDLTQNTSTLTIWVRLSVGGDVESTQDETELGMDPELGLRRPHEISQRFSVTVKVEVMSGDANQNAEVDVVIIVTDVDEMPMITDEDVDESSNDCDNVPRDR